MPLNSTNCLNICQVAFIIHNDLGHDLHEQSLKKEGNVLYNDTHNTFIYGYMASDMVNDHSDSER